MVDERTLRRAASAAAFAMAVLLTLLQTVLTPATRAPTGLYVLFTAIWVFGGVMLLWKPRFGAVGTALYGLVVAGEFWSMHGIRSVEDVAVVAGALLATALALAVLVKTMRPLAR